MEFNDLRLQDIRTVVYYCSRKIHFSASARQDHFIGINLSGTAYHDLGYKKLDLYPNYIYFFNQRDDFVGTTKEYGYCYSIHFTTVEPIETDSFCKKVTNPDVFVQKIRAVERAWLKKENGILQMRSLFYDFCSFMLHVMSTPYASVDARAVRAKEYMDAHMQEENCLHTVIERSGVTARRLSDLFKEAFHTTPHAYLIERRLSYAATLLETTLITVSEISIRSGFQDLYYFSKAFKQYAGVSPSEYRAGKQPR